MIPEKKDIKILAETLPEVPIYNSVQEEVEAFKVSPRWNGNNTINRAGQFTHVQTPEAAAREREYAKKVKAMDSKIRVLREIRAGNRSIPKDHALSVLSGIIRNKMREKGKSYVFNKTQNLKKILENLTLYFIGDNRSCYDLRKGIALYGDVGRGKTFIMQVFSAFCKHFNLPNQFSIKRMRVVAREVENPLPQGGRNALKQYQNGGWCLDDVGHEDTIVRFSNRIDCFTEIISELYDQFENHQTRAFLTTNLFLEVTPAFQKVFDAQNITPKASDFISLKYKQRIADRCRSMFNWIEIQGDSHRV